MHRLNITGSRTSTFPLCCASTPLCIRAKGQVSVWPGATRPDGLTTCTRFEFLKFGGGRVGSLVWWWGIVGETCLFT